MLISSAACAVSFFVAQIMSVTLLSLKDMCSCFHACDGHH